MEIKFPADIAFDVEISNDELGLLYRTAELLRDFAETLGKSYCNTYYTTDAEFSSLRLCNLADDLELVAEIEYAAKN